MISENKQAINAWIVAGCWIAVIAAESTWGSSENTGRILYPILHYVFGITLQRFDVWHHYIRKTGHFVGYFTLSFLLFRAWQATLRSEPSERWSFPAALVTFFLSVLIASGDEWHQSFSPLRTASVSDVILDSAAALSAQLFVFLILRKSRQTARDEVPVG